MKQLILLTAILLTSTVVLAEDTTTETCANGAGTVKVGIVSGYKYCKSNNPMNWWNAYAWCDAMGKELFSLNDCRCSGTTNCNGYCPELNGLDTVFWTATPVSASKAYFVSWYRAGIQEQNKSVYSASNSHYYALCK